MELRSLGGRKVGAIGLGAAGLSVADHPDEESAVRTIHAALDAGVTLLDTATCYVPSHEQQGHNEALLAKALQMWSGDSDAVVVASKAGIRRIRTERFDIDFETSGRPERIREDCENSLRALRAERLGLYQLHSPDPDTPLAETMGAFAALQAEGKIEAVGLCNVSVDQLNEARSVVEVASVQNRFSPSSRESLPLLEVCDALGIAFLAYSPLGGLGRGARELADRAPAFAVVARKRGVSPQQVALAWELAASPVLIPIPGARRPATIEDSAAATLLELTPAELATLNADS
jgi:aryl-alcohol dehydrogenase-like predicted oxidoreductase